MSAPLTMSTSENMAFLNDLATNVPANLASSEMSRSSSPIADEIVSPDSEITTISTTSAIAGRPQAFNNALEKSPPKKIVCRGPLDRLLFSKHITANLPPLKRVQPSPYRITKFKVGHIAKPTRGNEINFCGKNGVRRCEDSNKLVKPNQRPKPSKLIKFLKRNIYASK